jgi:hypothetical protein
MPKSTVRKGMASVQLAKEEFSKRARERFYDPSFAAVTPEIEKIIDVAWKNYTECHKSPRTRAAGPGFSDPEFSLASEWLDTRKAIVQAEKRQKLAKSKSRILLINGSTRSDQTCPGEMSKTFRLTKSLKESSSLRKDSKSTCWISVGSHRSTGGSSIPAKRVYPRPCRCVTGLARAIQTMRWGKSTTGWRKFTRAGWRRME